MHCVFWNARIEGKCLNVFRKFVALKNKTVENYSNGKQHGYISKN
jgi:hypothetical protein